VCGLKREVWWDMRDGTGQDITFMTHRPWNWEGVVKNWWAIPPEITEVAYRSSRLEAWVRIGEGAASRRSVKTPQSMKAPRA